MSPPIGVAEIIVVNFSSNDFDQVTWQDNLIVDRWTAALTATLQRTVIKPVSYRMRRIRQTVYGQYSKDYSFFGASILVMIIFFLLLVS